MTDPASPTAADAPAEHDPEAWRTRWPPMSYWVRWLLTLAAVSVVLAAVFSVFNVVVLVLLAAILAIGLDPAVRRIERLGRSRGRAVTLIFLGAIGIVVLFMWFVIPPLVTQVGELADDIPVYVERLSQRDDAVGRYFQEEDVAERLRDFIGDLPSRISSSFGTILGVAKGVASTIFNVFTVAILTIYFMLSLPRMRRTAAVAFAPSARERAEAVMDQAISRIGGYVAGILTTASIAGLSALAFFAILNLLGVGVPFAFPLAIWAALMGLIPAVGAYIGAAPAVIVGFFQSPVTGIVILVYFLVYQQVENYAIQPRVMKNAVNLSPAAVIVATLVFGSLGGVAGAVLALPLAATIKVVIVEVFLRGRVEEGDAAAAATLHEHDQAEAEAEAEAKARAASRRRLLRRLKERLGPRNDDAP
ncbi:MAG TPA: AI-2E family transporter [Actinomycetota bacterium]